jgi:hypothetical protein
MRVMGFSLITGEGVDFTGDERESMTKAFRAALPLVGCGARLKG